MNPNDQLARYYGGLNDEGVREALWLGRRAYEPPAWKALTAVARSRGIAFDDVPESVLEVLGAIESEADTPPWLKELRGKPPWIPQWVVLAIVVLAYIVFFVDDARGGSWFGTWDNRWLGVGSLAVFFVVFQIAPSGTAMRHWREAKRRIEPE